MRRLIASVSVLVVLSACQTTTMPQTKTVSSATNACAASAQNEIASVDAEMQALQSKVALGYQTQGSPVAFKNPIKLCKGLGPFAKACLPKPKLNSSLPTYEEYRTTKAQLKALEAKKAELEAKKKACGA